MKVSFFNKWSFLSSDFIMSRNLYDIVSTAVPIEISPSRLWAWICLLTSKASFEKDNSQESFRYYDCISTQPFMLISTLLQSVYINRFINLNSRAKPTAITDLIRNINYSIQHLILSLLIAIKRYNNFSCYTLRSHCLNFVSSLILLSDNDRKWLNYHLSSC